MIHRRTTKKAISLAQHHVKLNIDQLSFHVWYLKILLSKRKQKETGWQMKRAQLKHPPPQKRRRAYHHTCRQTLTQRNQSSSYQESLKRPPPRAQSKVFLPYLHFGNLYLTRNEKNPYLPGAKICGPPMWSWSTSWLTSALKDARCDFWDSIPTRRSSFSLITKRVKWLIELDY